MDGVRLQDLISRGMGTAARQTGVVCNAYRASGSSNPLSAANRFLQLTAAFNAQDPNFRRAQAYGAAVWYGVFDSAYTKSGDYLVELVSGTTWFVAQQPPLLPVVCVRTNRSVSFSRAIGPCAPGVNSYGGVNRQQVQPLLTAWPASVLADGGSYPRLAELPDDAPVRTHDFSVLLPDSGGITLRIDDMMADDVGRNFVVSAAEQSALGWRLSVKQVDS